MPTRLPIDSNNQAIQAMRFKPGGAQVVNVGSASARNSVAIPNGTRVVTLYATVDCYLRFSETAGDAATTSDHYFPAGVYCDVAIGLDTKGSYDYVHALRVNSDGKLYISERE